MSVSPQPVKDRGHRPQLEAAVAVFERRAVGNFLPGYIKQAWPIIEPGRTYEYNWHIDAICEYLLALRKGELLRVVINIPPRYMKSISCTVMFPTWVWKDWPSSRWIFASYDKDLSYKHSIDRRTILQSEWYQSRWGAGSHNENVILIKASEQEITNTKSGVMFSTSVGGGVTGRGGDFIVFDDPHNPQQALSDVQRRQAIDFYSNTLSTRLDNPKTGRVLIIMQRLHEGDMTGHVLAEGGYEHLCIPVEVEKRRSLLLPSGDKVVRERGDILWPERQGRRELDAMRRTMGPYVYAGQMLQSPAPLEGGLFKRAWFDKRWSVLPAKFDEIVQSWDCAFKDNEEAQNSRVVGQVWGFVGPDCYLIDEIAKHMDFTGTVAAVKAMTARNPEAIAKLIENKANGPAVVNVCKREVAGLIEIEPEGGKDSRAYAVTPLYAAGNVILPADDAVSWSVEDHIHEFIVFPNGTYSDRVDSASQALIYRMNRGGGMYAWLKMLNAQMAARPMTEKEQDEKQLAEAKRTGMLSITTQLSHTDETPWHHDDDRVVRPSDHSARSR